MLNKVLNIFQTQTFDRPSDQRLQVWPEASGQLLKSFFLEDMLYFAEASFDTVKLGTGRKIEDIPDAQLVESLLHAVAVVDAEIVPEQAQLSVRVLLAKFLDPVKALLNVHRLLVYLVTDYASLGGNGQQQRLRRLVKKGQVHLYVVPLFGPLALGHRLASEHALVSEAYLVALRLGQVHLCLQPLSKLIKLVGHVRLEWLRISDSFLLDAVDMIYLS